LPHAPQLAGSVLVLVHWLPHFVLPPLHTSAHVAPVAA
jgi:hypothetical protein